MNIQIARKLDYYLGIPLCWLLSVLCKLRARKDLLNQKKLIHPRKVLFIELCEMGSIILAYPAIRKVKKSYPEAEIYFLSFIENTQAVLCSGVISEQNIIGIRNKNIIVLLFDLWRIIRKLRKIGIDTTIDMNLFFRVTTLISYLTKASVRVGFHQTKHKGLYRGEMQTDNVLYNPHKHIKDNFLLLVKVLNPDNIEYCCSDQKQAEIKKISQITSIEPQDIAAMRKRLLVLAPRLDLRHKIVLINLGQNDVIGTRKWPQGSYNKLILRLLGHEHIFIVMIGKGHPGQENLIKHPRCLDIIDKTSIRDIIHLCKLAHAIVSHDCGMIHIASLTNIFICALFGPETPKLYAPSSDNMKIFYKDLSCSPCLSVYTYKVSYCLDNKCLKEISPQEVYDCLLTQVYRDPLDTAKMNC